MEELKNRGYSTVPEIARELIKEEQSRNGNALPWKDKNLYKEVMFNRSINSFEQVYKTLNISNKSPIFFDRGFLDTICYAKLIQSEIDEQMELYAENWRYNENIFILPPWQKIYETDTERKQEWTEAVLTYEKMCETYSSYGYNIVEIPKIAVRKRVDFILKFIKELHR
mgnify:FL=1